MAIRKRDHFKDDQPENIQRRKLISILTLVFLILVFALISYFVGVPLVRQFTDSPETFRDYIDDKGFFGQLLMIGIVALQVVLALLPGEPFEVGAGFIFGWVEGSILCLIGMAAASSLVYLCVKKWGVRMVELFFPREKIRSFSFLQNEKKLDLLVFILFLIPGTPKDMLTYVIGLTPMKLGTFIGLTTLARLPSLLSSTISGSLAQSGRIEAALITYGITLILTIICVVWYRKVSKTEKKEKEMN
ncbi:MAG: TVP38/TMEM64 family protein [Clostridia bacterium]|nr:TVP38/TMEM64 family protein [Clostridia bacterium]